MRPIADELLAAVGGAYESRGRAGRRRLVERARAARHRAQDQRPGRRRSTASAGAVPGSTSRRIDALLEPHGGAADADGACIRGWIPHARLRLWPHEYDAIYEAFDRIFDCRGHGWANLQSVHINLPFADDDEFGRLHAAIRAAAADPAGARRELARSSTARLTGLLDTRLEVYRHNAAAVPSVSGRVDPRAGVHAAPSTRARSSRGIYRDLAPLDPEGILRHEWVNARGAIARFDRGAIEIRVLDVQECPRADLAIAGAVGAVLRHLVADGDAHAERAGWHESRLAEILNRVVVEAGSAVIADGDYLRLFGFPGRAPARAAEVWQHLVETVVKATPLYAEWAGALEVIARRGSLARRIAAALRGDARVERLREVYAALCDCLRAGMLFEPDGV